MITSGAPRDALATPAPEAGPEIAVVDIRRIDGGLIAEGWEIVEPVAQVAANPAWWESTAS